MQSKIVITGISFVSRKSFIHPRQGCISRLKTTAFKGVYKSGSTLFANVQKVPLDRSILREVSELFFLLLFFVCLQNFLYSKQTKYDDPDQTPHSASNLDLHVDWTDSFKIEMLSDLFCLVVCKKILYFQ